MAMVVVVDPVDENTDTAAWYVNGESALDVASDPDRDHGMHRLFFVVPKTILQEPGVCPDLKSE
jgi:hypothetical protein